MDEKINEILKGTVLMDFILFDRSNFCRSMYLMSKCKGFFKVKRIKLKYLHICIRASKLQYILFELLAFLENKIHVLL